MSNVTVTVINVTEKRLDGNLPSIKLGEDTAGSRRERIVIGARCRASDADAAAGNRNKRPHCRLSVT